jgi:hypothetical protein
MARYFMHVRDGADQLIDPDGIEMPAAAVPGYTLASARDCMANDIHAGRLDLTIRIDVHDAGGNLVHSLPFGEAVEIVS